MSPSRELPADFRSWLRAHNWDPEKVTPQELAFLRACWEHDKQDPKPAVVVTEGKLLT